MDATDHKDDVERLTLPLWPDVGRALGLGKNRTYESARAGEIPGLMRFGRAWRVSKERFRKAMEEDR
jgi:excisionase family DNA binding protein